MDAGRNSGISGTPFVHAPTLHLNEMVYQVLKDHIQRNVLREGLVLRQGTVAQAFGVGRAPATMALRKLERDGLIRKRTGHGYVVGPTDNRVVPVELDLCDAGLILPEPLYEILPRRKRKEAINPEVESAVASCLVFGRFRINQTALAQHYGVSRTVASEILANLEGLGYARMESNARWYAGPLTLEDIKAFYELRWLMEPAALRQSAKRIGRAELIRMREHLDDVLRKGRFSPAEMERVETELHGDLVLRCQNKYMKQILRRSQLPIIATFGTVLRDPARTGKESGLPEALRDHRSVLDRLLANDIEGAAGALERHLRNAYQLCVPHFEKLPPLPTEKIPPYMTPER